MKYYYYDGDWYTYEYLHAHYGITLIPTMPVTLYDKSLNEYNCWEDSVEVWVDHQWYLTNDVPYYRKSSDTFQVYRIDILNTLECYDKYNSRLYKYDNYLYSYQQLHDNYGITVTPSTIYGVVDGIIWSWYNPEEAQYWDDISKEWSPIPPEHQIEPSSDINAIGSIGLFYYTEPGSMKGYGSDVNGEFLQPISINFPKSGTFSVTNHTQHTLTGTWRLLSVASPRTELTESIVMAMKVSNVPPHNSNSIPLGLNVSYGSNLVDL